MKFVITAVPISKRTRRRRGKSTTFVVDTEVAWGAFRSVRTPLEMEVEYEAAQRAVGEDVKVIDVRVTNEPICLECELPGSLCDCKPQGRFEV